MLVLSRVSLSRRLNEYPPVFRPSPIPGLLIVVGTRASRLAIKGSTDKPWWASKLSDWMEPEVTPDGQFVVQLARHSKMPERAEFVRTVVSAGL